MKINYIARSGDNGFIVVTDDGESLTFRCGAKGAAALESMLYIVNTVNAQITRDQRAARKQGKS